MRDARGRSPDPRSLGQAISDFRTDISPASRVASVQAVWNEVVGERLSAVTEVIEEREGTVLIECKSSVWAQELEMMAPRIIARLDGAMAGSGPEKLRFRSSN